MAVPASASVACANPSNPKAIKPKITSTIWIAARALSPLLAAWDRSRASTAHNNNVRALKSRAIFSIASHLSRANKRLASRLDRLRGKRFGCARTIAIIKIKPAHSETADAAATPSTSSPNPSTNKKLKAIFSALIKISWVIHSRMACWPNSQPIITALPNVAGRPQIRTLK